MIAKDRQYPAVSPCFTPGVDIATLRGEVLVENLKVGDKVVTRDNGLQPIVWIGRRRFTWQDLCAAPHLKPIVVKKDALGPNLPERDLMISPDHRVLVAKDQTAQLFPTDEALIAARHLVAPRRVVEVDSGGTIYFHFMFARHQVVLSNGIWTESFQPSDMALKGMGNAQRNEILDLFPELRPGGSSAKVAALARDLHRG